MFLRSLIKHSPLGRRDGMNRMVQRLFYTELGQVIVSLLFGIALALMLRRVCKDRTCIVFKVESPKNIQGKTFDAGDGQCYQYAHKIVDCAKESNDTDSAIDANARS